MTVSSILVDGQDIGPGRVQLEVTNRVASLYDPDLLVPSALDLTVDATFTVDDATYQQRIAPYLPKLSLFTVETAVDRNPWHRQAHSLRGRARRLAAGCWWTWRKRVLRRRLVETMTVTIPNCRFVGVDRVKKTADPDESWCIR